MDVANERTFNLEIDLITVLMRMLQLSVAVGITLLLFGFLWVKLIIIYSVIALALSFYLRIKLNAKVSSYNKEVKLSTDEDEERIKKQRVFALFQHCHEQITSFDREVFSLFYSQEMGAKVFIEAVLGNKLYSKADSFINMSKSLLNDLEQLHQTPEWKDGEHERMLRDFADMLDTMSKQAEYLSLVKKGKRKDSLQARNAFRSMLSESTAPITRWQNKINATITHRIQAEQEVFQLSCQAYAQRHY